MELVKAVVVFGVLALMLAAGGRAIWEQKPSLRLIVILGTILVAVLALALGYPDVVPQLFGGGGGAGLAK